MFNLPQSYGLWGGAETAIQVWNWAGPIGSLLQLIIIVGLVIVGMAILLKAFKQYTERDSQM